MDVPCEDSRGQAVLWAVGSVDHLLLRLKLHDALNRPEDLQNTDVQYRVHAKWALHIIIIQSHVIPNLYAVAFYKTKN